MHQLSQRNEHLDRERGSNALEFALIAPLLILLLFGIVDFGRGYNAQVTLTHAAREGVRECSLGGDGVIAFRRVPVCVTAVLTTILAH